MTYEWEVSLVKPLTNFLGFWPVQSSFLLTAKFVLTSCILLTVTLSMGVGVFFANSDREFMDNLVGVFGCITCIFEISVLKIKKKTMEEVLSWMNEHWSQDRRHPKSVYMLEWARKERTIIIFYYMISSAAFISFLVQPVPPALLTNTTVKKLHHNLWFAFNTTTSPNFEIILTLQYVGVFYICCASAASNAFMIVMIFHLCGQIDILCSGIRNYSGQVRHLNGKHCTMPQVYCGRLKCIVDNHTKLIRMTRRVDSIVSLITFVRIFSSVIEICAVGYIASRQKLDFTISLVHGGFMVLVYSVNLTFCWIGEQLFRTGEKISHVAYQGNWYELRDSRVNQKLLMIMNQANRPIRVTAGRYFTLSLQLFKEFFMMSVSYLSVVITVKQYHS